LRDYELILLIDPEADEERLGGVMERVKRTAESHGGSVSSEDNWGKRKLAYKIGTHTEATYHQAHLSMDADGTKELDNILKLNEDVIRHLLVRQEV